MDRLVARVVTDPSPGAGGGDPSPRTRCVARSSRTGEQCRAHAIRGGTVCVAHGGRAPQVKAAAAKREAQAEVVRVVRRLGVPLDVEPLDALVGQVREAAGNVAVLRALVPEDLDVTLHEHRALVAMYADERDRLARFSKLALDAGVDERRVMIAAADARRLVDVVRAAVDAMRPTQEQRDAALAAAAARMRELAGA